MIKKILIGVDDSKFAEKAAEHGFSLAQALNAHVGLVHIIEPMAVPILNANDAPILGTPMMGINSVEGLDILNMQDERSENIIERIAKKYAGKQEVTHFNEYGSTGEGIITCGKEFKADLIVIGNHSRSGLDRLLSGSIAAYIVRHSEIPVLVVPGKE
jgi:nucleotide-binding universal stress UspA family protein